MTILDKIIAVKRTEVDLAKTQRSEEQLRAMPLFNRSCIDFSASIREHSRTGIIAEYKRASPSKGVINDQVSPAEVSVAYQSAGASAISVLTDTEFFKGTLSDLLEVRQSVSLPILRKDFIVDSYQLLEAKAHGADVILLIAAVLSSKEIKTLSSVAKDLGLSVLVEVHNRQELEKTIYDTVDAIGVNNRNLHDFSVSLDHSKELVNLIPDRYCKISESGISDPRTILELKSLGFDGFLIGENFMKAEDPGLEIKSFSEALD